jgi:hypothetical protein
VIEVTLTAADVSWARDVGRQRIALAPGNPRFAYKERSGLDTHTIGAMAELAAAKAIGVPWPARVNTFRELPDLDPFWEVRWSSNPRKVKVAVDDKPELLVCHVTGQGPRVHEGELGPAEHPAGRSRGPWVVGPLRRRIHAVADRPRLP